MVLDQLEHKLENIASHRAFPLVFFSLTLSVAFILRLVFCSGIAHPGHADYSYYYTLAENIAQGRGCEIDYIWHYVTIPETVTHYANDYWMPFTSWIISMFFLIFGISLPVSILPSIFAGLILSLITLAIGLTCTGSRLVAYISFILILFLPSVFLVSLQTDSTIYYALFASLGLLFMIKGRKRPRYYILASACAGITQMIRQDGVLLLLTLIGVVLLSGLNTKKKLRVIVSALGVYCLVNSPLLILNSINTGSLVPSGSARTVWLTEYEDLYAFSKHITLESYLDWGIVNIAGSKLHAAFSNGLDLIKSLGSFLMIFTCVGLVHLFLSTKLKSGRPVYLPPLLFLGLLYVFYTGFATYPSLEGAFRRSVLSIIPFLIVIAIDALNRSSTSINTVMICSVILVFLYFFQSMGIGKATVRTSENMNRQFGILREIVTKDASNRGIPDVVIMTRMPWEVYHSTRFKTIQIPNQNIDVIYRVAQKYGATYLLLPGARKALESFYDQNVNTGRFQVIGYIPESPLKLYRIIQEF